MTMQNTQHAPAFNPAVLRGFNFSPNAALIRPGDTSYEAARRVWNGRIDKSPTLIIRCATVDDVVNAIRLARQQHLAVAVRGGGHGLTGPGTCEGGLVIDLAPLDAVSVDAGARRARAGGGTRWGALDRATGAVGLATTGGTPA